MTGPADQPIRISPVPDGPLVPAKSRARQSKIAAQLGWVSVGRLVGAVIQALNLVLVARWAGPAGFGAVGIALSVVVIVQTATDLGLPTYLTRERAARPENPAIRKSLQINNVTACTMSVILLAVFAVTGGLVNHEFVLLLPMALWAAADRNTDTWLGVTFADGDVRLNVVVALSRRSLVLLVMAGLHVAGAPALLAFSVSLAVVGLSVNVFVHRWVSRRLAHSDQPTDTRSILRASSNYWVISVSAQLRNLDAIIVGAVTGTTQVAFYSAAIKTTSPLRILPNSLAGLLVPAAARSGADRLQAIRTPVLVVFGVLTPIYATVIATAPWLVPWALGADFRGAVAPVQIICAGLIFTAIGSMCSGILQGVGKAGVVARVAVAGTVASLVGVLFGAMAAGAAGAALAMSACFVAEAGWLALILRATRAAASRNRAAQAKTPSAATTSVEK